MWISTNGITSISNATENGTNVYDALGNRSPVTDRNRFFGQFFFLDVVELIVVPLSLAIDDFFQPLGGFSE